LSGSLLEAIGAAVVVVDRSGTIVYANHRVEVLLGYEEYWCQVQ
jgi:PAS domain S-box-containing protein